ncbi:MAG: MBL fold metallo-hydrolase [Candidatus Adiutrix sp.]|jgi:phosphoribosyl 1,2-cyclic phosphodiesterase|nr:MBL fold metallo-hydrolase [Candidatus Adiutrix sp.]
MRVKFWGVRGSIPTPHHPTDTRWKLDKILSAAQGLALASLDQQVAFLAGLPPYLLHPVGGNTSCVEVTQDNDRVILDAGSGLRCLGMDWGEREIFDENDFFLSLDTRFGLESFQPKPALEGHLDLTILLSHTHWDHIQGFPFFSPLYRAETSLALYGRNADQLRWALELQQTAPSLFPVPLEDLPARIDFRDFPQEGLTVGALRIDSMVLPHPGGSLAYKISVGSQSVVYATDFEFPSIETEQAARFVEFISGADALIADTQYTYLESVAKEGWGHSTSFVAMDLAMRANVKSFFLFHHDPEHSDAKLVDNLDKTRAYYLMMSDRGSMRIELAAEGLCLDI